MAIGMTKHEFMHSLPNDLHAFFKSHKLKLKMRDEEMHRQGLYNLKAFQVVISHFGAGLSGKHSKEEYCKLPFLFEESKRNSNDNSNEEIAVFEMKQRTNSLKLLGMKESPM